MMSNLVRICRRQLHTIVSKEIIKPSSPTPNHLKTYNLSVIDQLMVNTFMPVVTFYPCTGVDRSSHDKTLPLKKSLCQTLTKYYPFAGRHAKVGPTCVDCNDNGAEFLEARIDTTLSDFLQKSQHEDLDQFFPHGLVHAKSNRVDEDVENDKVIPLAVQVNHFECGGVAVATSLSHKVADGNSILHFMNDWAKITRFCSTDTKHEFPNDPYFPPFQYVDINNLGFSFKRPDCVTRSFMFPNSKINDLKLKVKAMAAKSGQHITNPTRIEVLTWLLFKCSVAAAMKNNSGTFKPTSVENLTNIRDKMIEKLPEKSVGNFVMRISIQTNNKSEMNPMAFISELRKQKMKIQSLRNIETAFDVFLETARQEQHRNLDDFYLSTSLCRYPTYEIDFGWGKPVKVTTAGDILKNSFILMDAPNGDGVEVLVCLGKDDMALIQSDPHLLAFCKHN